MGAAEEDNMIALDRRQTATLRGWFLPERPGPLAGMHVIQTGHGQCWVDRWPQPRAVLVQTGQNYALLGDPDALAPDDLRPHVVGFVDAKEHFLPLLRETFDDMVDWGRVVYSLQIEPRYTLPRGFVIRRLRPDDAHHLEGLSPTTNWVHKTWYNAAAASGHFWGAFSGEGLISVACTFFLGERYEDVGVATEPEFRGLGLSAACAAKLCEDVRARGRIPSWTTSPENAASVRVAEKLGFTFVRNDHLYVIGIDVPEPTQCRSAKAG
jgi:RimJ/RimL family protein N-acetyltransferase